MKRSVTFTFVLMSALLMACSGGTTPTTAPAASTPVPAATKPPATSSQAAIELQFFYPVAIAGPVTLILDGYMDEFAKANPGLTAKAILAGSYADSRTKILTTLRGGGTPPDLAVIDSPELYTYLGNDAIIPLDDCIKQIGGDAYLNDFHPAFLLNVQAQGKTWGIPFQRSTPVLYYNKDLFKEQGLDPAKPPKTWDELVAYGQKLTKKDASGNVTQWGLQIPSDGAGGTWLFQIFAIQSGQNNASDDPTKVFFNPPSTVEGLQFWVDLSKKYKIMPEGLVAWATTPNDFAAGKTAMAYHTTGSLTNILKQSKFEVGVAFLPAKKNYGSPTGGGNLVIFKKTPPDRQAAACKLIQFLTTPERAAQWSIDTGYVGTRKSAYETPRMKDFVAKNPQYLVARDQLQYAQRQFGPHNAGELQVILADAVEGAVTGKKTAQQALDDAQAAADKILAQFK